MNVAFKCTYNDGGKGIYVGFDGTCTDDNIKYNIENNRYWCNSNLCECKGYYDRGFRGERPISPCYESRLFQYWEYGAGWNIYDNDYIEPRHIKQADEGDFVILTTRFPGRSERDRIIIGVYKVAKVIEGDEGETLLVADQECCIKLPAEEAENLYFWDYYSNRESERIFWGQGLYRYLDDYMVAQILIDVKKTIRSADEYQKIDRMLNELGERINLDEIPEPSGSRVEHGSERFEKISYLRKYGPLGEGESHKQLKLWIADHPEFLGLTDVIGVEVETHSFLSGDLPDLVFTLKDDQYVVVEIETKSPWPGAFQAVKYKSLLCAEKGLALGSFSVRTFLVAWNLPNDVKEFCRKYGVEYREKRLV